MRFFKLSDTVSKRTIYTFDIEIELSAANWYVPLWSPDKTYRVLLGLRTRSNRLFALARSTIANTSPSSAASISSERYAQVTEDFEVFEVRLDPVSQETSPEGAGYQMPQKDSTLAAAEKPSTNEYVGESFLPDAKVIGGTRAAATTKEAPVSRHRGKGVGRKDREQRESVNDVYAARTPDADDIFRSELHALSELRMHRLAPSKENEASPFDRVAACQEKTNRKEFSDLTARSEHEFTLSSMLADPLLQSRYVNKLEQLIELATKEVRRTQSQPEFNVLARMYQKRFIHAYETYVDRFDKISFGRLHVCRREAA
ncbi:MAG: DUF4912 domain-containing protein [Desulfoferrobacter sp.]